MRSVCLGSISRFRREEGAHQARLLRLKSSVPEEAEAGDIFGDEIPQGLILHMPVEGAIIASGLCPWLD